MLFKNLYLVVSYFVIVRSHHYVDMAAFLARNRSEKSEAELMHKYFKWCENRINKVNEVYKNKLQNSRREKDEIEAKVEAHKSAIKKLRQKYEDEKRLTKYLRQYKRKYRELEDHVENRDRERVVRQERDISDFLAEQKGQSTQKRISYGKYKTEKCHFIDTREGCHHGDHCKYAHSYEEQRRTRD